MQRSEPPFFGLPCLIFFKIPGSAFRKVACCLPVPPCFNTSSADLLRSQINGVGLAFSFQYSPAVPLKGSLLLTTFPRLRRTIPCARLFSFFFLVLAWPPWFLRTCGQRRTSDLPPVFFFFAPVFEIPQFSGVENPLCFPRKSNGPLPDPPPFPPGLSPYPQAVVSPPPATSRV